MPPRFTSIRHDRHNLPMPSAPDPDQSHMLEANRRLWDERVPIHRHSTFYDVDGFLAGTSSLEPEEIAEVGDVAGKSLLHLQCHFGLDTLSWARLGAKATGLDFSGEAVHAARDLATEAALEADFVEANLYDAPDALGGATFDVVYTGKGALIWLPDLPRWARVAASLVAPGGLFYLMEMHPVGYLFDEENPTFNPDWSYFPTARPLRFDEPGTYTDRDAPTVNNESYEWPHTLGEIVSAIAAAGLTIEFLHELDHTVYEAFPYYERDGRSWRVPDTLPTVPLLYSIRARKPA